MQGQRGTVQSFLDTFEFETGSSSSTSGVEQPLYWNNMMNPVETGSLPDFVLSPSDANIAFVSQDGSLGGWSVGGSSAGEHSLNRVGHDDVKVDRGWSSSLTIPSGSDARLEERTLEQPNVLSFETVDLSLSTDHVANDPLVFQNSNAQGSNLNLGGYAGNDFMEHDSCPHSYKSSGPESEHISSADPGGTNNAGHLGEGSSGTRSSLSVDHGRRVSCKRKNVEGVSGQSSMVGTSSSFPHDDESVQLSLPSRANATGSSSSTSIPTVGNSADDQLNPRLGININGAAPDCHTALPVGGNAESSQRSFRMRVNPIYQQDSASSPHLWPTGNPTRRAHTMTPHASSSGRLMQAPDLRASSSSSPLNHLSIPHRLPSLHRSPRSFGWSGASIPRIGSTSGSTVFSGERPTVLRDDASSRARSTLEHALLAPTPEMRPLPHDPAPWSSPNGNVNLPGNVASTSRNGSNPSNTHSASSSNLVPHQVPLSHFPRRLSEVVRRSLFSAPGSEQGSQSSTFPPIRPVPSTSSTEIVMPSSGGGGSNIQGHQPHLRSAFLMDRHGDGAPGVPLPVRNWAAASEGRSRLVSEQIRNVLDLMRRGENLRFEDVLILDQSVFYGVADLHDRHRDMRLDVDNMSYEELLALEERIGNVSTGLNEETVVKCLKQRKYVAITNASVEVEPCCICQEEYVDDEELGTLNCGHDFHTACIKRWLMHKNLCPVCKTTALVT
ncbi:probable E3 ubiquitin-protein ligase HIP1 isoform X1 [Amborella trichopoda]|uniref:probable E3 ubiquitin-protein ligase HIP1 isoform X1 n=1 Tax=Amborella trichopoda TaxID=13333 RepID=UPI0005D43E5B|nr:probable E3 ubiquitin-protein ligase HIP1 isoform X1 [Amborella trichopoda]XP_020530599.1 probable E3 ubiquitin-protein ligase HIP1 isoform X1 [Amborella trichopoda]|eukprot:XP_011627851.1 probable E3 ubiquitin-protein ligase HIP1 isoform X1 [Amborella trichopoda]